jgi:hypothetical protein
MEIHNWLDLLWRAAIIIAIILLFYMQLQMQEQIKDLADTMNRISSLSKIIMLV